MSKFDFDAHARLAHERTSVQTAIELANKKAPMGRFLVCITNEGEVLVLPEFTASQREDISQTVYDNHTGYIFSVQNRSQK